MHIRFGDRITARGEETVTLSRAEAKGLVLEGSRNGGVTVRGADANTFTVTACTAAAGDDDASARAVLAKVALRTSGGRVTIEGPDGERWSGFLLVTAPRDADFSVDASNGPVSLSDLVRDPGRDDRERARLALGPDRLRRPWRPRTAPSR